jgi:hypothetical protein
VKSGGSGRSGDSSSFIIGGSMKPIPEIGERLPFGIRPAGLYLFDPESEVCVFHPRGSKSGSPDLVMSIESAQ